MTRSHYILMVINSIYLLPLLVMLPLQGRWEFFAYIVQVIVLFIILMSTIKKTQFPIWLLSMLSVWVALHMAGGTVVVGDGVLYAYKLFHVVGGVVEGTDSYVLKYDQVIHFFGFFTTTFVAYWLLLPQLKPNFRIGAVAFVAMLASMGFGAINEIIEFGTVLTVPDNGVGGYYNTAIDLVANGLGATLAAFVIVKKKLGIV